MDITTPGATSHFQPRRILYCGKLWNSSVFAAQPVVSQIAVKYPPIALSTNTIKTPTPVWLRRCQRINVKDISTRASSYKYQKLGLPATTLGWISGSLDPLPD